MIYDWQPLCTCGHGKYQHVHYSHSQHCAKCSCERFYSQQRWPLLVGAAIGATVAFVVSRVR